MTQDKMSTEDENDLRWGKLAQRYEDLTEKLKKISESEEQRHQELMETMKKTNEKILQTAGELAYHPPVDNTESENNTDLQERRRHRKELYENRQFKNRLSIPKHGL